MLGAMVVNIASSCSVSEKNSNSTNNSSRPHLKRCVILPDINYISYWHSSNLQPTTLANVTGNMVGKKECQHRPK